MDRNIWKKEKIFSQYTKWQTPKISDFLVWQIAMLEFFPYNMIQRIKSRKCKFAVTYVAIKKKALFYQEIPTIKYCIILVSQSYTK